MFFFVLFSLGIFVPKKKRLSQSSPIFHCPIFFVVLCLLLFVFFFATKKKISKNGRRLHATDVLWTRSMTTERTRKQSSTHVKIFLGNKKRFVFFLICSKQRRNLCQKKKKGIDGLMAFAETETKVIKTLLPQARKGFKGFC